MKTCPSCGADVPAAANRCKECFHDFDEDKRPRSGGPLFLLAALAAMAIVGAVTLYVVVSWPLEERILVDEGTESVVWTRRYRSGIETERLRWEDVNSLEYHILANGTFEIRAITDDGYKVIEEAQAPLSSAADHYSQLMDKELSTVDHTHGFNKMKKKTTKKTRRKKK